MNCKCPPPIEILTNVYGPLFVLQQRLPGDQHEELQAISSNKIVNINILPVSQLLLY